MEEKASKRFDEILIEVRDSITSDNILFPYILRFSFLVRLFAVFL